MNDYSNPHMYDDIINLPPPISKKHPPMPMHDRAAQFAPFAALTGHDEAIEETARLTDGKLELADDRIDELNLKCSILNDYADFHPLIKVQYFVADKKKSGGAYMSAIGNFRRFDEYAHTLVFESGGVIPMDDIYSIDGDFFDNTAD